MTARQQKLGALILPLVVLLIMVARAELVRATGRVYDFDITGYDPRDLLRGQFLRFRVAWNQVPGSSCSGDGCCLCVLRGEPKENPRVSEMTCEARDMCDAVMPLEAARNLHEFFIPEDMGQPLEETIRNRRAAVRLSIPGRGNPLITDLLVDGKPWREVVGK